MLQTPRTEGGKGGMCRSSQSDSAARKKNLADNDVEERQRERAFLGARTRGAQECVQGEEASASGLTAYLHGGFLGAGCIRSGRL